MTTLHSLQYSLGRIGRSGAHWSAGWWHIVWLGALILVLAMSPSSYHRNNRAKLATHIVLEPHRTCRGLR